MPLTILDQDMRYKIFLFPHGATTLIGPGPLHCRGYTITFIHTTLSGTFLVVWSARRSELYQTTDRRPCFRLFRTHCSSKHAAVYPDLSLQGPLRSVIITCTVCNPIHVIIKKAVPSTPCLYNVKIFTEKV